MKTKGVSCRNVIKKGLPLHGTSHPGRAISTFNAVLVELALILLR